VNRSLPAPADTITARRRRSRLSPAVMAIMATTTAIEEAR